MLPGPINSKSSSFFVYGLVRKRNFVLGMQALTTPFSVTNSSQDSDSADLFVLVPDITGAAVLLKQ